VEEKRAEEERRSQEARREEEEKRRKEAEARRAEEEVERILAECPAVKISYGNAQWEKDVSDADEAPGA
jgi:hypothetical protein